MTGLKLHPRTLHVQSAKNAIARKLDEMQIEYDLTEIELLQAITEHSARILKYMLRAERHPENPDIKADEE